MEGKVVKSVTKTPMSKGNLKVDAYKTTLMENETYDVTALRIRAVDEFGNTLYYSTEPIAATVDGPLEIIGPSLVSLKGGMGGLYLKTAGKSGGATVTLTSATLGEVVLSFEVNVGC
jgi:beta-galactosidase